MTGLIVFAIPIACAALSLAGYWIARALKLASVRRALTGNFGFSFPAGKSVRWTTARAVVDGHDAAVRWIKKGRRRFFQVSMKYISLLPPSLEIRKRPGTAAPEDEGPLPVRLGVWDLEAINDSQTRTVFDKKTINGLWFLHDKTDDFSITAGGVDLAVPWWSVDGPRLAGLLKHTLLLAERLAEINRTQALTELALVRHINFMRDIRGASSSPAVPTVNLSTIEALIQNYRRVPGGRLELQRFLEHRNFEIGRRAAEALNLDLERYAISRMSSEDEVVRAGAARFLCELGRPGGLDFLADLYRQRTDAVTKIDVIGAFRDFPNSLSLKFLIEAAASGEESVRLEAVAALAGLGGKEEMAALYKLMADRALPTPLRQAVQAAVDRIKARLGPQEAGQLSLAQGESGGLSLAEGDSADGLSLPGKENPPDTES